MANETSTFKEIWAKRLDALQDLPKLWSLLWNSAPGPVFATITLRITSGFLPLAMLYAAKQIVDIIAAVAKGQDASLEAMWFWLAAEFALAGAGQIIGRAVDFFDAIIADRFTHSLGLKIMRHASTLDLMTFEDPTFHDRLERARVQTTDRIRMLTSAGWLLQRSVMLVTTAAGIVFYSPWLLVVLVLCVTPPFFVESHFAFAGYTQAHALTPTRRSLDYYLKLGSSRESAKEIKVFSLASHLERQYSELANTIIKKNRLLGSKRLLWGAVFAFLAAAGYYGSYAYLAREAFLQHISLGTFTFMVGAIAGANGHLQTIFSLFSDIADQALFLRDLILFLREKPKISLNGHGIPPPRPIRSGIEFENVSFIYPGGTRPVLRNLNFRLEQGQRAALVGENGEGKTTLVKLMVRLYDPTAGRILLDGYDLREFNAAELHKEVGVIFQDFMKYDWPVRDNIAAGNISQLGDDFAIWEASRKSNALELIEGLPLKLDQMLGVRFEGGVDLSGGQWQRMALARAYLREAQILILDEPTAALDPVAEHEVFQKFAELTRGKMALFISHRFSTVRMADRILLLSGGQITEDGSHERLLSHNGMYAKLFEVQAANYR